MKSVSFLMRWFASSATRINVDAAVRKNHGHGGVIILRHHIYVIFCTCFCTYC